MLDAPIITIDLITVKEAAAMCGVSEKWWRRHIANGTCPVAVYRIGKHIRLDRVEIILWLRGPSA